MDDNELRALWFRDGLTSLVTPDRSLNFRTHDDLNRVIKKNLPVLSGRFDMIVGIPRSGIAPAVKIALYLNLPFLSLTELLANQIIDNEFTMRKGRVHRTFDAKTDNLRILIVDDSINNGNTIRKVKERISKAEWLARHSIEFLAIFSADKPNNEVNYVLDICKHPRIFEWNMMHHGMVENFLFDLDGILCPDGPPENSNDGGAYQRFIAEVTPKIVPSCKMGAIVTSRLEKHREVTESWLKRNGFQYTQLIMMNLPSPERRRELCVYGQYKADVYKKLGGALFVESEPWQAKDISRITSKPVFCLDAGFYLPSPG
jgi:hypoxanthine phosphoribosyltransferase